MSTATRAVTRRSASASSSAARHGGPPLTAFPNGAQGSHILTSLLGADALAMIPMGDGALPAGSIVALEALAH